ncbi:MAG: excinuclease ABC subunit UvrC [Peptococcaceae bacterium]|jgi:excinuclease ABC subunit C|nr:excinuclease ABC subunit UvrC [Peptococcaceae bacterium]
MDLPDKLRNLPACPGVYLFRDEAGAYVYVGKARSLRNRVRQYFSGHDSRPRIQPMLERVRDVEYIVTDSEVEALVLESNLIKEHRPRYNVTLKDDKSYPYLKVTVGEEYPRVFLTRRLARDGSRYFGPYTHTGAVHQTLHLLSRLFPLRTCRDPVLKTRARPCLNYHIKRCLGPCTGGVGREEYRNLVEDVCRFLEGKHTSIVAHLSGRMEEAAENLEFERAAVLRDQIRAIGEILEKQKVSRPEGRDLDVCALTQEDALAVVTVFYVRSGRVVGRDNFSLEPPGDMSDAEIMTAFLKQFYLNAAEVPSQLVTCAVLKAEIPALTSFLAQAAGHRVTITVPVRGEKKDLLALAGKNAALALAEEKRGGRRTGRELAELAALVPLSGPPRRVEGYDISHTAGSGPVGVMVVATDGQAAPALYRRFKVTLPEGPDDCAALAQVVKRRVTRALARDQSFLPLPDLILVDGGKGQLGAVEKALAESGVDIPAVGLAKREETVILPGGRELRLPRDAPALHLLQRVRDEAHRFAVTYHKAGRRKSLRSVLEEIDGVGPARRKALQQAFGSRALLLAASLEELCRVPGMNRPAAENVYRFLHEAGSPGKTRA